MKPVKHAVSLVIRDGNGRFLVVQRPEDDEELPGIWGLPATSLAEDETWEDAAQRVGRDKLGVDVELDAELNDGLLERDAYLLHMRDISARIVDGTPTCRRDEGRTSYADWRWTDDLTDLQASATGGSLCCGLYLAARGVAFDAPDAFEAVVDRR